MSLSVTGGLRRALADPPGSARRGRGGVRGIHGSRTQCGGAATRARRVGRVADGTFGTCIVDGRPIEEQRIEAVPRTRYCLKHAQRLEVAASSTTPSL